MNRLRSLPTLSSLMALGLSVCSFALPLAARAQQQGWITPTQEELHMTSIPEVPGADAVILNRDEFDDDDMHDRVIYYRIKVLTEKGVRYGDVELEYDKRNDLRGYSMGDITGRTVQPDGTVVPFTGKPYDKVLEKDKENQFKSRVSHCPLCRWAALLNTATTCAGKTTSSTRRTGASKATCT
jgi:hypothetical protein